MSEQRADAPRDELISKLVHASLAFNLDDVSNNDAYWHEQMQELQAQMTEAERVDAHIRFEMAWAEETHYSSGMPITH